MTQHLKQRRGHCNSCPWMPASLDEHGNYFEPATLERTIVTYLNEERLHPCHSGSYFCTGYLSYVEQHIDGGVVSLAMGRLAMGLKLLTRSKIPTLMVFESIDEMLKAHNDLLAISEHQNQADDFENY
jgi:hypothetical protein